MSIMLLAAVLSTAPPDTLNSAIEHFHTVESYRATVHSTHADGEERIRYFYRKPGYVRMEFIHPHDGTVLVYNPITRRVRLWPFGEGRFPELNLDPDNPLIQSSRGQHVDRSDVGVLFENVSVMRAEGGSEILGEENVDGHMILHLVVTGANGFVMGKVHRYELWLSTADQFPIKVISRDLRDVIIETVKMEALEINVALPDALFNP